MKSTLLLSALLSFSSYTAAWPWPEQLPAIKDMYGVEHLYYKRQGNGNSASNSQQTASSSGPTRTTAQSQSASRTNSNSNAATITSAPTGSSGSSNSNSTSTDSLDYDPRLPAGGISMITPNPYLGSQFYKVGDWVTFAWNYTSLSATPTAINVYASCSANSQMYTLTSNMTVQDKQTLLWDTKAQATAQVPLLTNNYVLYIVDAGNAAGVSATPKAGYLGVSSGVQFGMYVPQEYQNWTDYQCATCSGAMSSSQRQTLGFMLGMAFLTVGSFTWFASGFGVF